MRSLGPIPNAAIPIEGSEKYRVSELLIAVLLLKLGFQARESSNTNIFFRASMYEAIVRRLAEAVSLFSMSAQMVLTEICAH